MSSETFAWAKEQRCGDRTTKAVLMEIANWAKPTGICEFLSVERIAEVIEVDARTVRRHLKRLVDELGMLKRIERHRPDGGQGANGFELVGYRTPKGALTPPDKMSPSPPDILSGKGVTPVSPLIGDKILPPSNPNGLETPTADLPVEVETVEPVKAHPLPVNWTAPAGDELPPLAQSLVRQWPSGAYEAVCETFRLHWLGETRAIGRKRDWMAALGKWLINDHPKVMRDAKAGVSFAVLAPKVEGAAGARVAALRTPAKDRETAFSGMVQVALRQRLGEPTWSQWFEPSAVLIEETGICAIGVTVIASSDFQRSWIEQRFVDAIKVATKGALGNAPQWVRFDVERPAPDARERAHA